MPDTKPETRPAVVLHVRCLTQGGRLLTAHRQIEKDKSSLCAGVTTHTYRSSAPTSSTAHTGHEAPLTPPVIDAAG